MVLFFRYLACGSSFNELSYNYLIGASTIRKIVKTTCTEIWNILQPIVMPEISEEGWLHISEQFYKNTHFPNIIGAIDGKHIRIIQPQMTGSEFFNYKKFFSVVLMAWVDADYQFVYIDVGANGAAGDSSVFNNSNMGIKLRQNLLNIPKDRTLPNDPEGKPMPFCLVADEAFGLSRHILRPFGKKTLTPMKKIYNRRQTTARRMVECTFGILANKWRIFHRPIDVSIDFCDTIIKSCCLLHNFVRKRDGINFTDTAYECPLQSVNIEPHDRTISAVNIRNYFATYFTSPQGSVPWQYNEL